MLEHAGGHQHDQEREQRQPDEHRGKAPLAVSGDPGSRFACTPQMLLRESELQQSEEHANGRQREPRGPAVSSGDDRHEGGPQCSADVDAHVEDREAGIATRAAFRIEAGDDGADVRLQQSDAKNDHDQTDEEPARLTEREQDVAGHDQDAAPPHRALCAPDTVRDPAAGEAQQVTPADVQAVDCGRCAVVEAEPAVLDGCDHEENQDRPHPVVCEALPHFGHEEREQPAGMAEPLSVGDGHGAVRVHAVMPGDSYQGRSCRRSVTDLASEHQEPG